MKIKPVRVLVTVSTEDLKAYLGVLKTRDGDFLEDDLVLMGKVLNSITQRDFDKWAKDYAKHVYSADRLDETEDELIDLTAKHFNILL